MHRDFMAKRPWHSAGFTMVWGGWSELPGSKKRTKILYFFSPIIWYFFPIVVTESVVQSNLLKFMSK